MNMWVKVMRRGLLMDNLNIIGIPFGHWTLAHLAGRFPHL